MTRAETYGHRFSVAVAEYLKANNLSSLGKINGRILAELAQGFHDNEKKVAKRTVRLALEGDWVTELEKEPLFQGIDVKQELGKMQWWCKQNNAVATRRRFTKWLMRALNDGKVTRNYDGATSRKAKPQPPKPRYTLETPVAGWPLIIRSVIDLGIPDSVVDGLCAMDWHELPTDVREKIIRAA